MGCTRQQVMFQRPRVMTSHLGVGCHGNGYPDDHWPPRRNESKVAFAPSPARFAEMRTRLQSSSPRLRPRQATHERNLSTVVNDCRSRLNRYEQLVACLPATGSPREIHPNHRSPLKRTSCVWAFQPSKNADCNFVAELFSDASCPESPVTSDGTTKREEVVFRWNAPLFTSSATTGFCSITSQRTD